MSSDVAIPADAALPVMVQRFSFLRRLPSGAYTSVDATKPGAGMALFRAMTGDAVPVAERLGDDLAVADILIEPKEGINQQTGEIDQYLRIVLILADGSCVSCGSSGIANSLAAYIDCFGVPPWSPPVVFVPRQRASKHNPTNKYYTLELQSDARKGKK